MCRNMMFESGIYHQSINIWPYCLGHVSSYTCIINQIEQIVIDKIVVKLDDGQSIAD